MTDDRFTCTVRDAPLGRDTASPRDDAGSERDAGGTTFEVTGARPVLLEMVARSIRALPVGCRGGGCGVCRVEVLAGDYDTGRMSRRHVSEAEEAAGFALACRLVARGHLVVRPAPREPAG